MNASGEPTPSLRLLVLTEDSAKQAAETMEKVVRKSCRYVDPDCQTHRIGRWNASDEVRAAAHRNAWNESGKRAGPRLTEYKRLVDTIATALCTPTGFVFMHFDGDRTWAQQHTSTTVEQFRRYIVQPVTQKIVALNHAEQQAGRAPRYDVVACLRKLVAVVPYYSIEAWLYRATDLAQQICRATHGGQDAEQFAIWDADPALLDEVQGIKDTVCLSGRYNHQLVSGFDPAALELAGKSYAKLVHHMRETSALMAALAATHE